ncbi:MAG: tRNA-queuosine alpha-mannosyltransferase domain-containing protein [Thermoleophilia bacterium]
MSVRPEAPPWLVPPPPGLRVWALEPYFGGSHERFLRGLASRSRHDYVLQTLPGRTWKWRMHGAALTLAADSHRRVARATPPHVLFVSDMLDLATYKALAEPAVATTPTILYMHENQLTYPLPAGMERDLGYGFKNITSALVADRVYFNSAYHEREFLEAVEALLDELPDAVPHWAADEIAAKSDVLPLGCDLAWLDGHRPLERVRERGSGRWGDTSHGPLLLWNQRWEYDKAPGELFGALYTLQERGVRFRLALAGANHGLPTAEFVEARRRLDREIVQWGRVEEATDYASLLWEADVVVSTALHEFFGVAVVEALYCGCRPVLPDRLSYPEIVPREAHREALYSQDGLVEALARAVEQATNGRSDTGAAPWSIEWQRTWVSRYDWSAMVSRYDSAVHECWEAAPLMGGKGRDADLGIGRGSSKDDGATRTKEG